MTYTDVVDGMQIMDVTYIGLPPKGTPPTFDIVKHVDCEPYEAIEMRTGERKTYTHYVYSVARLEWDAHEGWWQFRSVGTRWLEAKPTEAVVNMILKFCEDKAKELVYEDGGGD